MSEHNDPRSNHTSSGKDATDLDDDYLDTVFDADDPYDDGADQTFGQDNSYDPLSDDLFAQGNTVMFSDEDKRSDRSKWMIIGGAVLIAVALILGLKLLAGGADEPETLTAPAAVQAQPAQPTEALAADSDELPLLPTEIEAAMPTTQQQAEEQIDALTGEQELLDEQLAMYEEQLATSEELSKLKAMQIAALEKQLAEQSGASAADPAKQSKPVSDPAAQSAAQTAPKPTSESVPGAEAKQP